MDFSTINIDSPFEIAQKIADRVKQRRLELNLTQKEFAKRAGVGYDVYRKFENTGEITLNNLLLCAVTLNETSAFTRLFTEVKYTNLNDVLNEKKRSNRKRASKK